MMARVRATAVFAVVFVASTAGCGGVDDVCSATAGDFAGTYDVETWREGFCDCRPTVVEEANCAVVCADDIANNGFTCYEEGGGYCTGLRKTEYPTTFVIEADGAVSLATKKESSGRDVMLACTVEATSFCDLSFTCSEDGAQSIGVVWKKVK